MAHGADLYYDPLQLAHGEFNLVITSRWDKYTLIKKTVPARTRVAFYCADRYGLPAKGIPYAIGGVKGLAGQHYFLKRAPNYWFAPCPKPTGALLISLIEDLERNNARLNYKLEPRGPVLLHVLNALRAKKIPYRLHGEKCRDRWIYDQVAYRLMSALLHVKPWGSGSDWAIFKACAKGVPCIVYDKFIAGTTHEDVLPREANLILSWSAIQSHGWVDHVPALDGAANRARLLDLYAKGVPEEHVASFLKSCGF
jgi:hypothetical protein